MRNAYRILVRKSEGKRTVGRPRGRQKYITIEPQRTKVCGLEWIHMDQNRNQKRGLVNTTANILIV
jgi:hypothetical protein